MKLNMNFSRPLIEEYNVCVRSHTGQFDDMLCDFVYVRSHTGQFDDMLVTWADKLRKTEPNVMTLKIQKDVDTYKVCLQIFLNLTL